MCQLKTVLLVTTLFILNNFCLGHPAAQKSTVTSEFIILHNNDMHARFEQTSVTSGKCLPELANTNKCYGGFARVAHE